MNTNGNNMWRNPSILVFGNGWLGQRISEYFNCPISTIRINTYEDIQKEIDVNHPQVIINCVGHYGKNVDGCEEDKTKSLVSNVLIPLLLAEAAVRNRIKLVHISTGLIYEYDYKRNMPIEETDTPNFFDLFYSRTKIYTEAALAAIKSSGNILQLRILLPLDFKPHPRNLLDKLIGFKSVIDIPNSITYIPDFLDAMKYLIKNDAEGIYNVVNYGGLRFRTLLEEYRKYVPTHGYAITEPRELKLIRTNLILSTDKLEESGFPVRDINDVIPECVEKYISLLKTNVGQNKQTQEQESRIIPDGTAKV